MPQKNLSACGYLAGLLGGAAGMVLVLCLLCACVPLGDAPGTPGSPLPAATGTRVALPAGGAETGLCSLGDLSASMDWQRSSGALSARLVLANFGSQACAVQGVPQIELVNENGWMLPVEQVQNTAGEGPARVLLDPSASYTAEARFVWRNWCTPVGEEKLHLEVALPGYPGKLSLPVQDPNGHYLADTPRCDDQSASSTLAIEAFK